MIPDGRPSSPLDQPWSGILLPSVVGAMTSVVLVFLLSRLGVGLWMRSLGEGPVIGAIRELLATKTFQLTGLMLYGAHFVPVKVIGPGAEAGIAVPAWAHLIPILPLVVGGYLTVVFGRRVVGHRNWLGAAVALPYSMLLLVLIGVFSIKMSVAVLPVSIIASWEIGLIMIPLWAIGLGAVGGLLAGED